MNRNKAGLKYRIAGLSLELVNEAKEFLDECWNKFSVESSDDQCANIIITILYNDEKFYGIEKKDMKEIYTIYRLNSDILLVNKEWNRAVILPVIELNSCYTFFDLMFLSNVSKVKMLQMHASLVRYCSRGIMFLGPSGIGKTTQAELWNKYRDALIINGDIVFVQETPEGFLGWGTPWHGSSPYCENTSVPLKAMVVLKQAPENSIRELTGFEKVSEVSNSVFYPQWLENGMELCLETLDHLLTDIPVYLLSCRPDEDAVRLTEQAIFGGAGQ